jgi:cytochrome c biogenesis protein CcdA
MSNVSATSARTPDNQVLRLVAGLLIGFSLGVDVTGWFPQAAIRLRSPAMYIALVLVIVAAWWQKRKSEKTANPNI